MTSTPTTPETATVEVTQADREAAADIIAWHNRAATEWKMDGGADLRFFATDMPDGVRRGIWDNHDVVQAFARHRTRATRQDGLREALGEALFLLSDRLRLSGFLTSDVNHSAYEAVVAAFTALSVSSTRQDGRREIHIAGNGQILRVADVDAVVDRLAADPAEAHQDAIRLLRFLAALSDSSTREESGADTNAGDALRKAADEIASIITPGNFWNARTIGDLTGWCDRLQTRIRSLAALSASPEGEGE